MLYLGSLKQIDGDTYRVHHIITDHTKSCHAPAELEQAGLLLDAALPKPPRGKRISAVYVNIVTKDITCDYEDIGRRRGGG